MGWKIDMTLLLNSLAVISMWFCSLCAFTPEDFFWNGLYHHVSEERYINILVVLQEIFFFLFFVFVFNFCFLTFWSVLSLSWKYNYFDFQLQLNLKLCVFTYKKKTKFCKKNSDWTFLHSHDGICSRGLGLHAIFPFPYIWTIFLVYTF